MIILFVYYEIYISSSVDHLFENFFRSSLYVFSEIVKLIGFRNSFLRSLRFFFSTRSLSVHKQIKMIQLLTHENNRKNNHKTNSTLNFTDWCLFFTKIIFF